MSGMRDASCRRVTRFMPVRLVGLTMLGACMACLPGTTLPASTPAEPSRADDAFSCSRGPLEDCAAVCAHGDRSACRQMGKRVCREAPLAECNAACAGRNLAACATLGEMYDSGDRVARDVSRAHSLLGGACDGGEAAGCVRLGMDAVREAATTGDALDAKGASYFHRACALDAYECSTLRTFAESREEQIFALQRECSALPQIGDACGRLRDFAR